MKHHNLARIARAEGVPDGVKGSDDPRLTAIRRNTKTCRPAPVFTRPLKPVSPDNKAQIIVGNAAQCVIDHKMPGYVHRHPLIDEVYLSRDALATIASPKEADLGTIKTLMSHAVQRAELYRRYIYRVEKEWALLNEGALRNRVPERKEL